MSMNFTPHADTQELSLPGRDLSDSPRRPLVLVLGLPLGGGHMAAARGVKQHLELASPGTFNIEVYDISEHIHVHGKPISTAIRRLYYWCATSLGGRPYQTLYRFADRHPEKISQLALRLFGQQAFDWLSRRRPDVIISTYPLVTYIIATMFRNSPIGIVSVVTDAGRVNRLWWQGSPQLLLVTHQTLIEQASSAGVKSRVYNIGLIANPVLRSLLPSAQAKASAGLADAFTVLLACGGSGFGPNMERFVRKLSDEPQIPRVQFLVATGTNTVLQRAIIEALPFPATACSPTDLSAALLATDLVIGKAGWLTISECITAGKPIIVIDRIPGQEDENAEFIESLGIGKRMSVDAAIHAFVTYAADPYLLFRDFVVHRELHHSNLGGHLADLLQRMVCELQQGQ